MAKDYINIDLPPGIRANGTEYANRGAWIDGSRIRWANNALRPIGGWTQFEIHGNLLPALFPDPSTEAARALMAWRLNDGVAMFAAATNNKVYAWGGINANVHDITPLDFTPRPKQPTAPSGYGNWYYGTAAYGKQRPHDEDMATAFSWTMRPWGQNLLIAPNGAPSKLYQWDANFGNRAAIVPNAPDNFDCFHVTNQRIVMVAGDGANPRLVKWSDSEDLEDWTPRADNKAGFQQLQGVGRFRAIVPLQDQMILVSETDTYVASYIGAPFVFSFDQLAENCGTPSPLAVVSNGSVVMWPGYNAFFVCDGNSVNQVPCDVMDKFAASLNEAQASKTVGFVNPYWTEFWWLYQEGPDDLDSYIYYDWAGQHWGYGKLSRTAGGGYATVGGLLMIAPDGKVYRHEQVGVLPIDSHPSEVFAVSGPIEMAKGNRVQYVKAIQPDFIDAGQVDVTLIGRDRPGGPETAFGPYTISYPALTNQPMPARARGHTIKVKVEGKSNSWALGSMRLDFNIGGEK